MADERDLRDGSGRGRRARAERQNGWTRPRGASRTAERHRGEHGMSAALVSAVRRDAGPVNTVGADRKQGVERAGIAGHCRGEIAVCPPSARPVAPASRLNSAASRASGDASPRRNSGRVGTVRLQEGSEQARHARGRSDGGAEVLIAKPEEPRRDVGAKVRTQAGAVRTIEDEGPVISDHPRESQRDQPRRALRSPTGYRRPPRWPAAFGATSATGFAGGVTSCAAATAATPNTQWHSPPHRSAAAPSGPVKIVPFTLVVEGFVNVLGGDLAEPKLASHPGIGEDDVEGSRLGLHRRVESVEVGQIGDRALHRAGIGPEVGHSGVELFLPAAKMKTKAPSSMKRFAAARPMPVSATGDHGGLSIQSVHVMHPSLERH